MIDGQDRKISRNKTIKLCSEEKAEFKKKLITNQAFDHGNVINKIIHGDSLSVIPNLPENFVDLLIVDPPYNMSKIYAESAFKKRDNHDYQEWLESWMKMLPKVMKPNASIYICSDWSSSPFIFNIASKYFEVLNRITWEREKGRGALKNWKNCSEDIWYLSNGKSPTFNLEAVKLKRRVVAPYRSDGAPKGWEKTKEGNFRLTSPSNFWTDITVPFWSMPENTEHPTQKPEKLIAKLILASSNPKDVVFDPFMGSGTTAVVANKLGRNYVGIEAEEDYCLLALKRMKIAQTNKRIQGYENGIFLERNTMLLQSAQMNAKVEQDDLPMLL